MIYKIWAYISIFVIAGIAFIPTQTDIERYEREIEIVTSTYHSVNKECPNKNGINLQKAHYMLTVTSPVQRIWVDRHFSDLFAIYCFKFKRL